MTRGRRPPWGLAAGLSLLLAGALGAPASAGTATVATGVTLAGRPAYDQAVVTVAGGRLSGLEREVDAIDPSIADGRAIVRLNGRGLTARPATRRRDGVTVRLVRRPRSVLLVVTAPRGRFKFVQYRVDGSRTHLVVRLWRATTAAAARVLDDRCLRLTRWAGGRGSARVRGLELKPLFEHTVVTSLRGEGEGGTAIALRPRTATGFRFLPDFSGYSRPGRFGGPLPYSVPAPTRAMLEAWSASAKDGSLECLVQTPVILRP